MARSRHQPGRPRVPADALRRVALVGLLIAIASGGAGCDLFAERPEPNARREPAAVQKQLPLGLALANLCPSAETDPADARMLRRQAEVLLRELERRPDWVVRYVYVYEDGTRNPEDITVRRLAEEQLELLDGGDEEELYLTGRHCEPELRERIRTGLAAT